MTTAQQLSKLDEIRDSLYSAHAGISDLMAGHDPATLPWQELYAIMQSVGGALTAAANYQKRHDARDSGERAPGTIRRGSVHPAALRAELREVASGPVRIEYGPGGSLFIASDCLAGPDE